MLTCLTLQRSNHRASGSFVPVTSQLRAVTVCGLMQLQKGCLRAHKAEVRGTKFKSKVLYWQCVWSRSAFLLEDGEKESRTASWILCTGSARAIVLTGNVYVLDHPAASSTPGHVAVFHSFSTLTELGTCGQSHYSSLLSRSMWQQLHRCLLSLKSMGLWPQAWFIYLLHQ